MRVLPLSRKEVLWAESPGWLQSQAGTGPGESARMLVSSAPAASGAQGTSGLWHPTLWYVMVGNQRSCVLTRYLQQRFVFVNSRSCMTPESLSCSPKSIKEVTIKMSCRSEAVELDALSIGTRSRTAYYFVFIC